MAFAETFEKVKDWCLGTRNMQEAQDGIRRDTKLQVGLKTWSKRLGKAALVMAGLTVLTRAGFMLFPTLAVCAAYGGVKLAGYLIERDIRIKREAAEEFVGAENGGPQQAPAPSIQPSPKPAAKATGSFNADAAKKAAPPVANANAQKPPGLLKRFGIG
jgi:hypothetical protein